MMLTSIAIAMIAVAAGPPPSVPNIDEQLREAHADYNRFEFEGAIRLAEQVLAYPFDSQPQRADAYVLEATCYVTLGKMKKAEEVFRRLLRELPRFSLPIDGSPKIREPFERVRAAEQKRQLSDPAWAAGQLTMSGGLVGATDCASALRFRFTVYDPGHLIQTLFLHVREQAPIGAPFSELPLTKGSGEEWTAETLVSCQSSGTFEYYVEGFDSKSNHRIEQGSKEAPNPFAVRVDANPSNEPLTSKNWFWWTIGIVVVAAAGASIAAGVALNSSSEPKSNLGVIHR